MSGLLMLGSKKAVDKLEDIILETVEGGFPALEADAWEEWLAARPALSQLDAPARDALRDALIAGARAEGVAALRAVRGWRTAEEREPAEWVRAEGWVARLLAWRGISAPALLAKAVFGVAVVHRLEVDSYYRALGNVAGEDPAETRFLQSRLHCFARARITRLQMSMLRGAAHTVLLSELLALKRADPRLAHDTGKTLESCLPLYSYGVRACEGAWSARLVAWLGRNLPEGLPHVEELSEVRVWLADKGTAMCAHPAALFASADSRALLAWHGPVLSVPLAEVGSITRTWHNDQKTLSLVDHNQELFVVLAPPGGPPAAPARSETDVRHHDGDNPEEGITVAEARATGPRHEHTELQALRRLLEKQLRLAEYSWENPHAANYPGNLRFTDAFAHFAVRPAGALGLGDSCFDRDAGVSFAAVDCVVGGEHMHAWVGDEGLTLCVQRADTPLFSYAPLRAENAHDGLQLARLAYADAFGTPVHTEPPWKAHLSLTQVADTRARERRPSEDLRFGVYPPPPLVSAPVEGRVRLKAGTQVGGPARGAAHASDFHVQYVEEAPKPAPPRPTPRHKAGTQVAMQSQQQGKARATDIGISNTPAPAPKKAPSKRHAPTDIAPQQQQSAKANATDIGISHTPAPVAKPPTKKIASKRRAPTDIALQPQQSGKANATDIGISHAPAPAPPKKPPAKAPSKRHAPTEIASQPQEKARANATDIGFAHEPRPSAPLERAGSMPMRRGSDVPMRAGSVNAPAQPGPRRGSTDVTAARRPSAEASSEALGQAELDPTAALAYSLFEKPQVDEREQERNNVIMVENDTAGFLQLYGEGHGVLPGATGRCVGIRAFLLCDVESVEREQLKWGVESRTLPYGSQYTEAVVLYMKEGISVKLRFGNAEVADRVERSIRAAVALCHSETVGRQLTQYRRTAPVTAKAFLDRYGVDAGRVHSAANALRYHFLPGGQVLKGLLGRSHPERFSLLAPRAARFLAALAALAALLLWALAPLFAACSDWPIAGPGVCRVYDNKMVAYPLGLTVAWALAGSLIARAVQHAALARHRPTQSPHTPREAASTLVFWNRWSLWTRLGALVALMLATGIAAGELAIAPRNDNRTVQFYWSLAFGALGAWLLWPLGRTVLRWALLMGSAAGEAWDWALADVARARLAWQPLRVPLALLGVNMRVRAEEPPAMPAQAALQVGLRISPYMAYTQILEEKARAGGLYATMDLGGTSDSDVEPAPVEHGARRVVAKACTEVGGVGGHVIGDNMTDFGIAYEGVGHELFGQVTEAAEAVPIGAAPVDGAPMPPQAERMPSITEDNDGPDLAKQYACFTQVLARENVHTAQPDVVFQSDFFVRYAGAAAAARRGAGAALERATELEGDDSLGAPAPDGRLGDLAQGLQGGSKQLGGAGPPAGLGAAYLYDDLETSVSRRQPNQPKPYVPRLGSLQE